MFRTLLIANRGEVAARVVKTARRLGVRTVLPVSSADADQAWLEDVDIVVPLGPAHASRSYLNADALLEIGRHHGCSAVHPGWGFLAENDVFASRCAAAGLTFVGPAPSHLRMMGDKALARKTMADLGMPVIPGSDASVDNLAEAVRVAEGIGYPIFVKAVAGGGGRGMRFVESPRELAAALSEAAAESQSAFGDGRLYLERRIERGRHIEVQVVADGTRCLAIGERECSLQRRHQKVLEEAPSPGLSEAERARILPLVADVVGRSGYRNAGTVEMLLDADGQLWFMEMNTRLQVEHPVSEEVTGIDLVEWQLRVAANETLPDVPLTRGHAIECRINAEDPDRDFAPSPGLVTRLELPTGEGIRVDTHLREGDRIPPWYDSMIAKIIVHAEDRAAAIARMRAALSATHVAGVTTNIELHRRILDWQPFCSGNYDTTSLEHDLMRGAQ